MKKLEVNELLSILNKEDIERSMLFIDKNGIPKGRQSNTFDVISDLGQKYPPPFLLETAYKQKTGEELPGGFFDNIGKDSPHFKIIEALGFNIMGKNQNRESIKNYLEEFAEVADEWFEKEDWFQKRYHFYKNFYVKESLEKAEWEDFQDMGNHIHSFNTMAIAKMKALGKMTLPIEEYRRIFLYIISGDDPINVTINNLYKKYEGTAYLPYFSDSSISELIAYAYPEKYVTYNRRDEKALEILGLKLDNVKAEKFGDKFLRYNKLLLPVLEQYKTIVGKRTKATYQLELDQFFSWLYETKKADKPIRNLINRYKTHIKTNMLEDEKYKWELLNQYKGKPDLDAPNFYEEIKSVKFSNLIYAMAMAVIHELAKEKPEELRSLFKNLFNEKINLSVRIKSFNKDTLKLYRDLGKTLQHHQDERSMATYLTFHNPEKYTFYKYSFYRKLCKLLSIKEAKKNEKYVHYLELINHLIDDYLVPDEELINQVKNYIPEFYDGKKHNLLAQDILYQMLDKEDSVNYWIFQGNPKVFDFEAAIAEGNLDNFTVSAHKDKIKLGDKVIIWLAGKNSGCYALAEITSEPQKVSVSRDDKHWKVNDPNDIKAGIRITHNLFNQPILWDEIADFEEFANFKGGNQGTNFTATEAQFSTLLTVADSNEPASYAAVKKVLDPEKFDAYLRILKDFVKSVNLDPQDKRVSFNVRKSRNRLVFLIGNRYSLCIDKAKNKTNISFVSEEILSKKYGDFKNQSGEIESHWNIIDRIEGFENKIKEGLQNELDRNNKCPFRKYTNQDFINDVFNLNLNEDGQDYKSSKNSIEMPKNQILYGPPGTGKTYALKKDYFPLYTSKETSITAEKNFETVVKGCSWWEAIAVALIQLGESKVNDIYSHKWVQKKAELSNSNTVKPTLWSQLQSHTIEACETVNVKSKQQPLIFNKTENSTWEIIAEEVENQIPELYDLIDKVENFKPNPDKVIERFKFVTFHQSFSYEDFIEGIKPIMPENGEVAEDLGYTIEDGVFKDICKDAANDPDNRYAIFIDEINRGNVSAIFGELITLIETDKRTGAANEMDITLPYSKKKFSVPSNLDIYGTMNTADRSVEALDTALRRRFEFIEMMPDYTVIEEESVEDIKLAKALETINHRIELLIDRDHNIGHSYFVNVNTANQLAKAFNNQIVPLLQEYFYGDYGKIGLVLGKGFIEKIKNDKIEFASFDYENANDFKTPTFVLKHVNRESIVDAVNLLLRHIEVKETE